MTDILDYVYGSTIKHLSSFPIGEFYLEDRAFVSLRYANSCIDQLSSSKNIGFSVRAVDDTFNTQFYANHFTQDNFKSFIKGDICDKRFNGIISGDLYPATVDFLQIETLIETAKIIDNSIRNYKGKSHIDNVIISLTQEQKDVGIIRNDGNVVVDKRPLLRITAITYISIGDKSEKIVISKSMRHHWDELLLWVSNIVEETHRTVQVFENAQPIVGGVYDIVFGPGDPGILLHEAIGHGLEGDFNSKDISVFSGLIGKKISHNEVTIIDDGTIPNERGSVNFDDEGNPTARTILVKSGVLKQYMVDRINGKKLNITPANGRRESYADLPMPRMTNTFMLSGSSAKEDMIRSVKNGIYAVQFSNGSVDITSGQFAFVCCEAYEIKNGKIGSPLLGCCISGMGLDVLGKIKAVGNDHTLAEDGGTCGKYGQSVPVGVGQPHILVDSMLVSGS